VTDSPFTAGFDEELTAVVVPDLLTVCVKMLEVLVLKLESPPYTAVIECDVTDRALVLNVAWPPLNGPVPKVVAPSLKVTVPVGEPAPGEFTDTVAVNVTDCPEKEGFGEALTVVVVAALVILKAEDVAPVNPVAVADNV